MSPFIVNLINQLTYLGIFLGTFVEGPIVGLLSGFLIQTGFLKWYLAYIAHVLGDMTADIFYYFLGYHGQKQFFGRFYVSDSNLKKAQDVSQLLHRHPRRIIILAKLTHIVGLPVLLAVGMSHYSWSEFVLFDFIATLVKSALLITLGYYLTESWPRLARVFIILGWPGILFIVLAIIIFLLKNKRKKGKQSK